MHVANLTDKLVNLSYQVTFKCLCHMPVLLSKCIPIVFLSILANKQNMCIGILILCIGC